MLLTFNELEFFYKLHNVTGYGLKACREKLDEKLGPEKRRKRLDVKRMGKPGLFMICT